MDLDIWFSYKQTTPVCCCDIKSVFQCRRENLTQCHPSCQLHGSLFVIVSGMFAKCSGMWHLPHCALFMPDPGISAVALATFCIVYAWIRNVSKGSIICQVLATSFIVHSWPRNVYQGSGMWHLLHYALFVIWLRNVYQGSGTWHLLRYALFITG